MPAQLLSHILIGKYVDHLPLYRQQKQIKRLGVEISEKTICGWVAANLLFPLYEKLMQHVGYIQADETPIVIPQILAASILGFLVKHLFDGQTILALVLGGVSMIAAGFLTLLVEDKKGTTEKS
jgi:hypothetical protein